MPGRNATGPNNQGPMTGRGLGNCGGRGQGGAGRGQGFGFGGSGGRGQRNRFQATNWDQPLSPENEGLELRDLAAQHENALSEIKQRIDDLEKRPNDLEKRSNDGEDS